MNGPPEHLWPHHNLVILTNGKDLLFANAGTKAEGGPFTGSLWPVGGEEPSFPTHDDEAVMSGPPEHL